MQRVEICFLLGICAILTGLCLLGLFYYEYSATLMRFPLMSAGVVLVVAMVQLGLLWNRPATANAPVGTGSMTERTAADAGGSPRRSILAKICWLFLILPLVLALGYPVGLAIYLLLFLKQVGESWKVALGISGTSLLLSYGLFVEMLGVPLPLLPSWWVAVAG